MQSHLGRKPVRDRQLRRIAADPVPDEARWVREVLPVRRGPEKAPVDIGRGAVFAGDVDVNVLLSELKQLRGEIMLERLLRPVEGVVVGEHLQLARGREVAAIVGHVHLVSQHVEPDRAQALGDPVLCPRPVQYSFLLLWLADAGVAGVEPHLVRCFGH
jgi:hypothetical protein